MHVGCADDGQPPAAGADETAQLREQIVDLGLVADGISADECRPGDDAVREEGTPRGREQVALVAAQREEGEAVAPVSLDERPRDSPLPDRLYDRMAERSQPEVEREDAEGETKTEERIAGAVREVAAAQLRPDAEGGDPHERCAEAEQRLDARRVAGDVEAAPPANERHEQEHRDRRLFEVQALGEVRDGGRDDDRDGELPGSPSTPGERAREPDQAEAAGDGQDSRGFRPARREDALDDPDAVGHFRCQRRREPDHADESCGPGKEPLGTGPSGMGQP